jgi:hypothetical protein
MVDHTIKESRPSDRVYIFNEVKELIDYVENSPIRAEILFVSRDTMAPSENTSLSVLIQTLKNPFFKVDKVIYFTEFGSKEISSINFLLEMEENFVEWETETGPQTREMFLNIITGMNRSDSSTQSKKRLVRYTREEYIKKQRKHQASTAKYVVDEEILQDVELELDGIVESHSVSDSVAKVINITGLQSTERSLFTYILSQYLATNGKVVMVESDYDYLTLTNLVNLSGHQVLQIDVSEFRNGIESVFTKVKRCSESMILITTSNREEYDYGFLCNLVYANLSDSIHALVSERNYKEVEPSMSTIVVLQNSVPQILKALEFLPTVDMRKSKFVCVNSSSVEGLAVPNSNQVSNILSELLQKENVAVDLINFRSMRIGFDTHILAKYV